MSQPSDRTTSFKSQRTTSLFSAIAKPVMERQVKSKLRNIVFSRSFVDLVAKKVTFFRNGDVHFQGFTFPIRPNTYRCLETLIAEFNAHPLCDISILPTGIRYIFSTDGKRILSMDEFEDGKSYVFSSSSTFKRIPYGCYQVTSKTSSTNSSCAGKVKHLPSAKPQELGQYKTIYAITAGTNPRRMTQLTINRRPDASFNEFLHSLSEILMMKQGSIRHLCSTSRKEMKSIEDLFQEDSYFVAFDTDDVSHQELMLSSTELLAFVSSKTPEILPSSVSSDSKDIKPMPPTNQSRGGDEHGIPFTIFKKYKIGRTLLRTESAKLTQCFDKCNLSRKLLMKVMTKLKLTTSELDAIYSEVSILRQIKHANILKFVDELDMNSELYVIVEHVMGVDILSAIVHSEVYTENEARGLILQLCEALNYLHSFHIVHRDIKPDNILVSTNKQSNGQRLLLAGLSMATFVRYSPLKEICGSIEYTAPEMLHGDGYNTQIDVWSAGVILYQILCGLLPFNCKLGDRRQTIKNILSKTIAFPVPEFCSVSYQAQELVVSMLMKNPEQRWRASELLELDWFKMSPQRNAADLQYTVVRNLLETGSVETHKTSEAHNKLLASTFCDRRSLNKLNHPAFAEPLLTSSNCISQEDLTARSSCSSVNMCSLEHGSAPTKGTNQDGLNATTQRAHLQVSSRHPHQRENSPSIESITCMKGRIDRQPRRRQQPSHCKPSSPQSQLSMSMPFKSPLPESHLKLLLGTSKKNSSKLVQNCPCKRPASPFDSRLCTEAPTSSYLSLLQDGHTILRRRCQIRNQASGESVHSPPPSTSSFSQISSFAIPSAQSSIHTNTSRPATPIPASAPKTMLFHSNVLTNEESNFSFIDLESPEQMREQLRQHSLHIQPALVSCAISAQPGNIAETGDATTLQLIKTAEKEIPTPVNNFREKSRQSSEKARSVSSSNSDNSGYFSVSGSSDDIWPST